jgi:hypothetical protein
MNIIINNYFFDIPEGKFASMIKNEVDITRLLGRQFPFN